MFESNELMRSYWERSTQDREDVAAESLRIEQYMPEDLAELQTLSGATFDAVVVGAHKRAIEDAVVKPLMADEVPPPTEAPAAAPVVEPAQPAGLRTTPGNNNANATFWVALVSVLVFILLAYIASRRQ